MRAFYPQMCFEGSCGGGRGLESARYLESPSTVMDVSRVIWFLCGLGAQ